MPNLTVVYQDDTSVHGRVYDGLTICDALRQIGNVTQMNCGGRARCATCKVRIVSGYESLTEVTDRELKRLGLENVNNRFRLACQTIIHGDVVISRN